MCGGIAGIRGNVIESQKLSWPSPLTWQGAWAPSVTYNPGDVLRKHNGIEFLYYIARDKNTTNPRTDIHSHWWELSDSDRPIVFWHQFAPGEIHPDDPDQENRWQIDTHGATSGTYDVTFALADDQTDIRASITVDASSTDFGALQAQINAALSASLNYTGSTDAYEVQFIDFWLGAAFVVIISNDTTDGGGVTEGETQPAIASGIDAPLGSILIGQGFALTDGYLYVKVATGPHDWVELPELPQPATFFDSVNLSQSGTTSTLVYGVAMRHSPRGVAGQAASWDFWSQVILDTGDGLGAGNEIVLDLSDLIAPNGLGAQGPINWIGSINSEGAYGVVQPVDGVLRDMLGNPILDALVGGDNVTLHGTLWSVPD